MYDHNVHYLDHALDQFFHELDTSGILDDTLVVLTADHGEELFDLGGLYHGWHLNPFVLSVPLYVHYPRSTQNAPAPGTVIKQGANLVDVVPTIMGVIGMNMPQETNIQGVDLRRLPTMPSRIFPAFSWQSMHVGLIHSDQSRLEVVESESGQTETYSLRAGQWSFEASERSAAEIGAEVAKVLTDIHARWR